MTTPSTRSLAAYVAERRSFFEQTLGEMVEIPSISMDPQHTEDVRRMARYACDLLRGLGARSEVVDTQGHPVVTGGWTTDRTAPTVMIYNHLDVQPAQEPEWRRPPFAFHNEDGLYRGRGTTDDKGPALAAALAAKYVVEEGVPINIRVLWELEEEIGSPHLAQALRSQRACPRPDSVVVSDTVWIARGQPAIPYGLRGLVGARLILRTGTKDAHSGVTGGAARNPLAELCALVQACVDARTGRVKIPGFYDDVVPLTPAERRQFVQSGFTVRQFKAVHGFRSLRASTVEEVVERLWALPTFEVHGLAGGYSGPGIKTVVPGYGELKVSMRLVPDQKPQKVFAQLKRFVKRENPDVRVEPEGQLEPFRGVFDGPFAAAIRRAVAAGFGKEPVLIREGGSIGAVAIMARTWRVPILFLGLSLPEHGYHAPNEYFDWGQASGGIKAFAAYFTELAHLHKGR
jgi:acetylornithine deacetylase/succinyl-diaminopimelate desuccinylase-like protein